MAPENIDPWLLLLRGVSQVSLLVLEFLLGFLVVFDIFKFARVA